MGAARKAEMGPGAPAVHGGVEGRLWKDPLTQELITSLAALQGRLGLRKARQPRLPPPGTSPGPGAGRPQSWPSGCLVTSYPTLGRGGEFQRRGFLPLPLGPPAPYPVHAHRRLTTFQPVTLKAVPEGPTPPTASQSTPVLQLGPVSCTHLASASGALLTCAGGGRVGTVMPTAQVGKLRHKEGPRPQG